MQLILASGSPRRRKLLEIAEFHFRTDPIKISEIIKENLNPTELLMDLARQKSDTYMRQYKSPESENILVLTADTMVFLSEQTLGKPQNETQAVEFLNSLSANTHSVLTGVCLYEPSTGLRSERVCETKINFLPLTDKQITDYVASGEPMDKAGAYGIQGRGGEFVDSFEGSWTNVVGLPMEMLDEMLTENDWDIPRNIQAANFKSVFENETQPPSS